LFERVVGETIQSSKTLHGLSGCTLHLYLKHLGTPHSGHHALPSLEHATAWFMSGSPTTECLI